MKAEDLKAENLRTKTPDELQKLLLDQKKEQFNMRFQRANGAMDNTSEIRKARRAVARIKTFINMSDEMKAASKPKTTKASIKKVASKPAAEKAKAKAKTEAKKKTA